jgi:membrane protease YdiL (CAAX protease family)
VDWASVGLFLAFAFVLSWTTWIGLGALGVPFLVRTSIGMFGPAASALLVRLVRREGFGDLGLRISRRGGLDLSYLYAYAAPPLLILAGVVLALLLGGQHLDVEANFRRILAGVVPAGTRLPALPPPAVLVAAQVLAALTYGAVVNTVFAMGEELGWRGHLVTRLEPLGGVAAALLVGVVWGLWHAPLIVISGYEYPGHPLVGPFYFCLFTVPLSVILSWLRWRSGSVWPCALAHGLVNAMAGLAGLLLSQGNPLVAPPVGLIGIIPLAALATWLIASGRLSASASAAGR